MKTLLFLALVLFVEPFTKHWRNGENDPLGYMRNDHYGKGPGGYA